MKLRVTLVLEQEMEGEEAEQTRAEVAAMELIPYSQIVAEFAREQNLDPEYIKSLVTEIIEDE